MIGRRIKHYRQTKQLTLKALAALVHVSQGSLSDIENAKTKPSADTLVSFALNTDICPIWLLTGQGEMLGQGKGSLDPLTSEVLKLLLGLDERQKRDVLHYAKDKRKLASMGPPADAARSHR